MDRETEGLAAAFAALSESNVTGPGCPPAETLWTAVRAELPAEQARQVVDHLAGCAGCAEAWRLARELQPMAPSEQRPSAPAAAAKRPQTRWLLLAAAAAAVVASLPLLLPRLTATRGAPVYREGQDAVLRSLLRDQQPLPRDRFLLRWSAAAEGARYDLTITSEDLTLLERARGLDRPQHQVPGAALTAVPSGARVLWRVEAVAPDGTRTASGTFVTRVE